jgi:hypothetical protein
MNIAANCEELNEADWSLAIIADMSPSEVQEDLESLIWEQMHYESVIRDFGDDTRQGRYAQQQIDVIEVIVDRLQAALGLRSYDYAQAS